MKRINIDLMSFYLRMPLGGMPIIRGRGAGKWEKMSVTKYPNP